MLEILQQVRNGKIVTLKLDLMNGKQVCKFSFARSTNK